MKIFLNIVVFTLLLGAGVAGACEPCNVVLNFEETAVKSDLVIIGQKVAEGPTDSRGENLDSRPEWIEVEIKGFLQGHTDEKRIRVNSWDGMCSYGIIVDYGLYVMLLQEQEGQEAPYDYYGYDAVDYGCAQKTYPVQDGLVYFENRKMTVDDFAKMLLEAEEMYSKE